ncbi:MAG: carbohydrate-binding protein, partial [Bacteroidota bacterium]
MKKTLLCLFCLIQLGAISLTNAFGQGTPIRVFLLGGQSNMTGFSQIVGLPGDLGQTRENVRIWEDAQWETNGTIPWGPLRPGLGRTNGQPHQFIGPELTFGRAMSDYFGGQTIALIKSSLGATRLAIDWRPPSSGGNRGPLYDKFINDTRFAMGQLREQGFDPTIVGMIWMQGESDGVDLGMSNEYERNLTNLINDLRRDIPANNMPVGIGKIDVQPAWPHNAIIRQAEENVVRALPNMGIFDTRGFETDGVHYFQAGMIRVGYGFADVMKQLVPVVVGVQSPFADVIPIPGVVEAENFDNGGENIAYHDTTPTNLIGPFRTNTAVDIENCSEGGSNLAFSDNGEWLEYTVKVATSGAYAFDARVSSPFTTGRFHIEMDGTNVTGALAVPNTGGWQTWTNVSKTVNLTAGQHIMRFVIDAKEFNTNKFNFTGQINPGEVIALPGTLEAENFDNGGEGITYHDTEEANQGGVGSRLGPDVFTCVSSEGTNALGWINNGEWVEYTVNAASAGSYTINARVASVFNTGVFHLEWDGNNISGNIPVPNTGDWQAWQSVTKTVTLTAGRHILRIFADAGNFNLNKITFSTGGVNNDPFPIS